MPRLAFDVYARLPGLNWSTLKHACTSARHYKLAVDGQHAERADSSGLRAMHAAVLEPDTFDQVYRPWVATSSRRGAAFDAAREADPGVEWLTPADHEQALAVARAVAEHPVAAEILAPDPGHRAMSEPSIVWVEDGRTMKGRLDRLVWGHARRRIVDLKAVPDLASRKMAAWVARQLYHGQMAHYVAGVRAVEQARGLAPAPIDVYLLAYSLRPCVDVGVFYVGEARPDELDGALYCGAALRAEALARVAQAEASGVWAGACPDIVPLELPAWAYGDDDDPNLEVTDD